MSCLGSLYSETSTVENKLFHSPWRWWLSLSEKAHVTVIEFTSEIQIYEWSSFREKSAGIKHRLGVKVQSKRSKSRMALKFSKVLRSQFSHHLHFRWVQWSCDVVGYFEEIVYKHELEPEWHACVDRDGLVDVNSSSGICRQNFDFFSNQPHIHHTHLWARCEISPLPPCL